MVPTPGTMPAPSVRIPTVEVPLGTVQAFSAAWAGAMSTRTWLVTRPQTPLPTSTKAGP